MICLKDPYRSLQKPRENSFPVFTYGVSLQLRKPRSILRDIRCFGTSMFEVSLLHLSSSVLILNFRIPQY